MITRDQVRHVARLARLQLTEDEETRAAHELSAILAYVEQLGALPTDAVPPTTSQVADAGALRDDVARPGLDTDAALAAAPERVDGFFAVPRILETGG